MPCQFILHMHQEHTAADYATDHAKFLTHDKQGLIRNAVKTAPMNTASELIKKCIRLINEENQSQTQGICRLSFSPRMCQTTYCCVQRRGAKQRNQLIENSCGQNFHQRRNTGTHTRPVHWCATIHRLLQDILHWQGLCRVCIGEPQFIDCFKTCCIGTVFVGFELCAMIAFFTIFNLLNMIRCIASG